MPSPARARLLPGAPRRALGIAVAFTTVQIVLAATGALPATGSPARLAVGLPLFGCLAAILLWRARRVPQEREVWGRVALAGAVVVAVVAVLAVLGTLPGARAAAEAGVQWAPVAAFPLFYSALVRWNRHSTSLADPNDVLNGLAAVLAVVAVASVVIDSTGGRLAEAPWTQVQPLLAQCAAGFVLVGTAASLASLGSMARDPRLWLVTAAFAGLLAGSSVALVTGERAWWGTAAESLGALCLAVAATLRPARSDPQPTDPAASTIGAFVVIVAATAVLVAAALGGGDPAATWCASLAALGASVRLLVNVRELAQLAVSRREALTDELTGLANRRAVLRRVGQLCDRRSPLAFALLDLDKFKEVNDGLGHSAGDELLRLVAARLKPMLRPGDVLGRLGGDEFAVVAPMDAGVAPEDAAAALGRRLADQLAAPFRVGGMSVHVAASIGLACCSGRPPGEGAGGTELLLQWADAAMYDAKRTGTGVAVYDSAQHGDSSRHLALVEELRAGLGAGQLVLHHQPQVDVVTGRTVGVEALVRWAHPVRGLLGPAEFLPLAEVHGLMRSLTDEVLRQAVAQAADWRDRGLDLRVSVNLSASNLLDTDLPCRVARLLAGSGLPPERLVLEVTESVLLSDPDRSLAVVGRLAELGVTVSIDDFGTGYSSLSYLRVLPVAELKLDRSFTADLLTDARNEAIVASTVTLAHRLGLRVVAEGVEHPATLAHLAGLGCDESQGFLHSPPLPADRLEAWLAAQATDTPRSPLLLRS
ncbi:putative bifunctional diguanylate cyclase/phosphodiesterase [Geodermatophilus sp. CPCC 206100]|uniref:putative bifunctional diguanylate cyclase/phosphodiesterase n=1 Tax=Geodermatophilus sp. CPCC 206100 TaxID=3020054 RepID=UPI003AFFADAD